jgi:hypothetical protein
MSESTTRAEVFEGFHITATPNNYHPGKPPLSVAFRVVECTGEEMDGTPLYGEGFISDPSVVPPFLSGDVKWDGCSNWDWHTSECMQHFCTKDSAVKIGVLMGRLYDLAAEMIPGFDHG